MSDDGSLLFFSTPGGVRVYSLGDLGGAPAAGARAAHAFRPFAELSAIGLTVRDEAFRGRMGNAAGIEDHGLQLPDREVLAAAGLVIRDAQSASPVSKDGTHTIPWAGDRNVFTAAAIDTDPRADALGLLSEV